MIVSKELVYPSSSLPPHVALPLNVLSQPSEHSSYVLAYCHLTNSLRTFKIERIEGIEPTSEPYVIPSDFDANAYLSSAWGVFVEGEVKAIRLRFAPDIARLIEETI